MQGITHLSQTTAPIDYLPLEIFPRLALIGYSLISAIFGASTLHVVQNAMDFNNLHLSFETVTAGITAATLVAGLLLKVRSVFKSISASLNTLLVLPQQSTELAKRMDEMQKQLRPDGGSSLMDKVDIVSGNVRETRSDLKELRLYVEALAEKQKHALHLNDGCLLEFNTNGMCNFVNRAFVRLTGRMESELIGTGWLSCLHTDDRRMVLEMWEEAVTSSSSYEATVRFIPVGTERRHLRGTLHCAPVYVTGQGVTAWLGSFVVIEPTPPTSNGKPA